VALFAAELVVGVLLRGAQGLLNLTSSQAWALGSLIANGCVFATVMQYRGLTYRALFHPAGTSMRDTALALVPWVVMLVPALVLVASTLVTIVTQAFPLSDSERALFERLGDDDLATMLLGCVIAPVVEEMLFRGVNPARLPAAIPSLARDLGSAVLFGLAHLNIYQFVAALLLGAVSGWLYERSRSLVPCIAPARGLQHRADAAGPRSGGGRRRWGTDRRPRDLDRQPDARGGSACCTSCAPSAARTAPQPGPNA